MIGFRGLFVRIYVLASVGGASALTAKIIDRGCFRISEYSICASGPAQEIAHSGWLEAGFPPYQSDRNTFPVCQKSYSVDETWLEVQFDVDDWCLKGMNGQKIACCDKEKRYNEPYPFVSPYADKHVGFATAQTDFTWENAFPKSLKYLTNPIPLSNNAFDSSSPSPQPPSSWDGTKTGTEAFAGPSNINAAGVGSILHLDDILALNPVAPGAVPENLFGQNSDVVADNVRFLNDIKVPKFTAPEPEENIFGF